MNGCQFAEFYYAIGVGLPQSPSDSRCFSLLLLTLIRAIEYD